MTGQILFADGGYQAQLQKDRAACVQTASGDRQIEG